MCKLMEELTEELYKEELAEGRAEAEKNTLLDNIRSLMETLKSTAQQAMDALKVPVDKQKEYVALIRAVPYFYTSFSPTFFFPAVYKFPDLTSIYCW